MARFKTPGLDILEARAQVAVKAQGTLTLAPELCWQLLEDIEKLRLRAERRAKKGE